MHMKGWLAAGAVSGAIAVALGVFAKGAEPDRQPGHVGTAYYAQLRAPAEGSGSEQPAAQPITYIKVTAEELERFPRQFENKYVQVADFFQERLDRPPRVLREQGISADAYEVFLTHRATGSNMICVLDKKNQEATAILDTLVAESPIYLMGKVGPTVETDYGGRAVFVVDRLARGHEPPPPPAVKEEKKPALLVLEVPEGSTRRLIRRWKVKSGEPYVIPDPHDKTKVLIITVEF